VQSELPRPLVLVVEDDDRSRELVSERFAEEDCQVIAVEDPDDAVWEIRSSPGFDLLFTDVRLRDDDDEDDTSGMLLGEYVKSVRPEIPVAVFSSKFREGELDQVVRANTEYRFDLILSRGGSSWYRGTALDECVRLAKAFRDKRFEDASNHEDDTSKSHIKVMREFIVGRSPGKSSDEVLKESGYTLRLLDVRHGELRGPIAVWVLEQGDRVSAELYQRPHIHAVGRSLKEALDKLAIALHGELDTVAPDGEIPNPDTESIPWLMLQHVDKWDQPAEQVKDRD